VTTRPPRIDITIERLVLRGLSREQRNAVVAHLKAGLLGEMILADPRTLAGNRSLAGLRPAPLRLATAGSAVALGTAAGRSIGDSKERGLKRA